MSAPDRLQQFRSLVSVAVLDGTLHPAERAVLEKIRARWEIPEAEARAILDDPPREPVRISKSLELAQRLAFFKSCAEVVYADGVLADPERRLLLMLREKLEIPEELLADLLRPFAREGTSLRAAPVATSAPASPPPPAFEVHHGPPERPSRAPIYIGVGVFAVVAVVAVWWMIRDSARRAQKEVFDPALAEYLQPVDAPEWIVNLEAAEGDGALPDLPGAALKYVVLDAQKREVADLHLDLPESVRAANPAEVGTIVWLVWDEILEGYYTDGAPGYVVTCQVTLIDRESRTMIWRQTFFGSDPPGVKKHSGAARGSNPSGEVVQFLRRIAGGGSPAEPPVRDSGPLHVTGDE